MAERWRSKATRDLVKAIRKAGGTVERGGVGKLTITGPAGTVTINEPGDASRRDKRSSAAEKRIAERTGLNL
jgi:hypothetical protein